MSLFNCLYFPIADVTVACAGGLVVSMLDSHFGGPGSIPHHGGRFCLRCSAAMSRLHINSFEGKVARETVAL